MRCMKTESILSVFADSIDAAEDRERFQKSCKIWLKQPNNRTAHNAQEAVQLAEEVGYPVGGASILCLGRSRYANRV